MVICPSCGVENPDEARFCKGCGAEIKAHLIKQVTEAPRRDYLESLLAYVEKCHKMKFKDDIIRKELLKGGCPGELINKVLPLTKKQDEKLARPQPQGAVLEPEEENEQRTDIVKPLLGMYRRWQSVFVLLIVFVLIFAGFATWEWFSYKDTAERLTGEVSSLNAQLAQSRGELSSTQSQLSESLSQLQIKEGKLSTTQNTLTATEGDLRRTQEDLTQAQETATLYKGQADDLSQELSTSTATLNACFSDVYYSMNYSYVRSSDLGFKLLCAEGSCGLSPEKLEGIFFDMQHATLSMEETLGIDIKDYYRSVEVHATRDALCRTVGACAYATSIGYSSGLPRGLICFDAPGCESSPAVFIHELAHQLWHKQGITSSSFNEGFSKVLESILGSQQEGSGSLFPPDSFCDMNFASTELAIKSSRYSKGRYLFHELCQRHGFDIDDLPAFFDLAEQQPTYHTTGLSFETFISFISQITGQNVKPTFDQVLSIPTEGAVCGNGKCEVDERYYCDNDC